MNQQKRFWEFRVIESMANQGRFAQEGDIKISWQT
jgi:hypothetical protein